MTSDIYEIDDLDDTKNEVMVENNAHEIHEHLKALGNEPKHRQRWIWELLQNAQDAGAKNVHVVFKNQILTFSHDGTPFTKKDITHVIFHGSSKAGDKTGKFGTGFMTTHLISKKVRIIGNLMDDHSFNFTLNREAQSSNEMVQALNTSWGDFKNSIRNESVQQTSFIYSDLTLEAVDSIKNSLERIHDTLPMVLAFSNGLELINVNFEGIENSFLCKSDETGNGISILLNGENSFQLVKRDLNGARGQIAMPFDQSGRLIQLNNDIPRIFIVFPLIGTEQAFELPFFINSPDFQPSKEREKLWLKEDTSETRINKSILEAAFLEFVAFAKTLVTKKTLNIHLIADLGIHQTVEWIDHDWYKDQLVLMCKELDEMSLVIVSEGEPIPFSQAKVACPETLESDDLKLWELLNYLYPEKIPTLDKNSYWQKIINQRKTILEIDDHDTVVTFEKLCQQIDSLTNHKVNELVVFIKPLEFLQKLIANLEDFNIERHWQKYAVLPNQSLGLCKQIELSQELIDTSQELDDTLKDIAEELGYVEATRSRLLHREVIIKSINYKPSDCKRDTVTSSLLKIIKTKPIDQVESIGNSCIRYFNWNLRNQITGELIGFPLKMQSGKWFHLIKDPFLLPPIYWPDSFRKYQELFPSDFILHSSYNNSFVGVDLKNTPVASFFLFSPLIIEKAVLKPDEIAGLVTRRADKDIINSLESDNWQVKDELEVSKIAYLSSPSDKSILDRTRGSMKLTRKLLEFVTEVLLVEDTLGFTRKEITLDSQNGSMQIGIYPCSWLLDLKRRDWVKNSGSNSGASSPSTESFIQYFTSSDENRKLYDSLKDQRVSRFLYFLNIPVGDIIRNIRSETDEERFDWDQSYVTILMNRELTPQRVTKLLSDMNFIQEYEAKQAEIELRNKNAEIGYAVEQAFEEAFRNATGFKIKREPRGSDYVLESDFPHTLLISKDEKTKFWIEIKSSRAQEVRMTSKQGEVADRENEKYILCVVPIHDETIDAELIIRNSRFITNISYLLKNRVEQVNQITSLKNIATSSTVYDSIQTSIEGFDVRYVVGQKHWITEGQTVHSFSTFVNGLIQS